MSFVTAQCGKQLSTINDTIYMCQDCGEAICENHAATRSDDHINFYCLACVDNTDPIAKWHSESNPSSHDIIEDLRQENSTLGSILGGVKSMGNSLMSSLHLRHKPTSLSSSSSLDYNENDNNNDDIINPQTGSFMHVEINNESIYNPILEYEPAWKTKMRKFRYNSCFSGCCIL